MNVREWDVLAKSVCNLYRRQGDRADRCLVYHAVGFFAAFISFFIIGATLDALWLESGKAILIGILVPLVVWQGIPFLGRIHILHGVENRDLRDEGMRYLSLNKDERGDYPRGIINVLKDPDLEYSQKCELARQMNLTYETLRQRREARAVIVKRNVDINPLLEEMQDRRKMIESDVKVYRQAQQW